jgi:hypothetical protein
LFSDQVIDLLSFETYLTDKMHEASNVMGYLDIEGCAPFDTLDCQFDATCFECSSKVTFKKVPLTGMEYSENCLNCHKKLSISAERYSFNNTFFFIFIRVKYIKIRAMRAPPKDLVVQKKKKVRDPRMIGIKVGTPLPDQGACKHYKRSLRWFRFPCCQRLND